MSEQKPTIDLGEITAQSRQAVTELLAEAKLEAGDVFVIGCSSSEIVGGHIGRDSSMEAAANTSATHFIISFFIRSSAFGFSPL